MSESAGNREDEELWLEALRRLGKGKGGDLAPLAELLRGDGDIPRIARDALAELLLPETGILDMRLVVKEGGRESAEKKMRLRSEAIQELEAAQRRGLPLEVAADDVARRLGLTTGRAVLKRADLRNPRAFHEAHRDVSKLVAIVQMAGGPQKFFGNFFRALALAMSRKTGS
jgi:hypothetical protein